MQLVRPDQITGLDCPWFKMTSNFTSLYAMNMLYFSSSLSIDMLDTWKYLYLYTDLLSQLNCSINYILEWLTL